MAFFMGDRLFRFDERAPESEIPDLPAAVRRYRSPGKAALVRSRTEEDPAPWMAWRATAEWGDPEVFTDLLDFLVNVPSLAEEMGKDRPGSSWHWERIPPQAVRDLFPDSNVQGLLSGVASPDEDLLGGWILAREYGRVDEDCTFSDSTWLFATPLAFVHLRRYQETLH